jgi:hypothetical protein
MISYLIILWFIFGLISAMLNIKDCSVISLRSLLEFIKDILGGLISFLISIGYVYLTRINFYGHQYLSYEGVRKDDLGYLIEYCGLIIPENFYASSDIVNVDLYEFGLINNLFKVGLKVEQITGYPYINIKEWNKIIR